MNFVAVQGCPVPAKLAPFLRTILRESGAHLQSVYRGQDPNGVRLLHKLGKSSQADLYNGWLAHRPGFNPANRPGTSTHELRNDGVAYGGAAGRPLPWWAVGLDVDDAHVVAFIRAAARHGWKVSRTYPTSSREYHHVNFRKPPLRHRLRAVIRR